jgi:hypothetical protein
MSDISFKIVFLVILNYLKVDMFLHDLSQIYNIIGSAPIKIIEIKVHKVSSVSILFGQHSSYLEDKTKQKKKHTFIFSQHHFSFINAIILRQIYHLCEYSCI